MINPQAYPQRKNVAASPVIEPRLRHDPNTGMHKHVIHRTGSTIFSSGLHFVDFRDSFGLKRG